jgi:hypothetical protein
MPLLFSTASLIAGFEEARTRFDAAAPSPDRQEEAFRALFETVAWVGAIRDRLIGENQPRSPEIDGVYFVRNLVIHRGADALHRSIAIAVFGAAPFGALPFGGGADYGWRWRNRDDLPPHKSKTGLSEYDAEIAGNRPTDTFAAISAFLDAST